MNGIEFYERRRGSLTRWSITDVKRDTESQQVTASVEYALGTLCSSSECGKTCLIYDQTAKRQLRGSRSSGKPVPFGWPWRAWPEFFVELKSYRPECWHTSRFSVVKVLAAELQVS